MADKAERDDGAGTTAGEAGSGSGSGPGDGGRRPPDPYAGTGARRTPGGAGRGRHAATRLLGGLFAMLAMLVVLLVGGTALKLRSGPVDISRFAPYLAARMSEHLPGAMADVEGATLTLPDDRPGEVLVALRGLTLSGENGAALAEAPNISGVFAIADALRGHFKPRELIVSDVKVAVRRLEEGRLVIDGAATGGESAGMDGQALLALLSAPSSGTGPAAEAPASGPAETTGEGAPATLSGQPGAGAGAPNGTGGGSGLAQSGKGALLSLENAELTYSDDITGRTWRAAGVSVTFAESPSGVQAVAEIDVEGGRFGRQTLQVRGYRTSAGALYLDGAFSNIAVADIASQITALEWLAPFEAPVAGRLVLALDRAGTVTAMSGELDAGGGVFRMPGMQGQDREPGAVTAIRTAGFAFEYEPLSDRFSVSSLRMDTERGRFDGEGLIELERSEAGALTGLVAQATLQDVSAIAPEFFAAPLIYDRADMTARLRLDPFRLEIGDITLARGEMQFGGAGVIRRAQAGFAADLILRGQALTAQDLLTHWPPQAAGNARDWVAENVIAGQIEDVNASIRLGGRKDVLSLDFTFSDIESRYLDGMPPIRRGAGAGQLDLTAFHLSLTDGEVAVIDTVTEDGSPEVPVGGEPLALGGSRLSITGLDQPVEQMNVELMASGPAAAMLAIIDRPPLGLISKLGTPILVSAGGGDVRADISFPLLKNLLVEDVRADATASLRSIRGVAGPDNVEIDAREIDVVASADRMTLKLRGAVHDVPVTATWQEDFETGARAVSGQAAVSPAILARFAGDQPWFTDGLIDADVRARAVSGGYRVDLDADLTRAALKVPQVRWRKKIGEPGRLSSEIDLREDTIFLGNLNAGLGSYEVVGDVSLTSAGAPLAMNLRRLKIPGELDAALKVERTARGWKGALSGAFADIPKLRARFAGGDGAATGGGSGDESTAEGSNALTGPDMPEVDALLDLGRIQLTDQIFIADARGSFATGPALRAGLTGLIGGEAAVSLDIAPADTGASLAVTSDNAGRLMRALGVFDDGSGGVLDITATLPEGAARAADGVLRVRDLIIHDDAKLERILIGGELEELRAKMGQEGLRFRKIIAPFIWRGDALKVKDAVARGGDIGVTIDGLYFIDEERLDMKGVFTPLYGVNSVLGNIPLLGDVLTGGDGQGVFALNYSVTGAASDPKVNVNPLSLLAPGILRKLVDGNAEGLPPPERPER